MRREGCLDIFCSTPIEASKCLVNGQVAIPHEVCPGDASVFCVPGETFNVGSYAQCKCKNGIKALASCKPIPQKSQPRLSANTSTPSVEAQLNKCSKSCTIEVTKQGDKVIKSVFNSSKGTRRSLMQGNVTRKVRKSLMESSAEDAHEAQDSVWATPPVVQRPVTTMQGQFCKPEYIPVPVTPPKPKNTCGDALKNSSKAFVTRKQACKGKNKKSKPCKDARKQYKATVAAQKKACPRR